MNEPLASARLKAMREHKYDTSSYIDLGPGPDWLHDGAIEKCAQIAEITMACGCGRSIAKDIRQLLSTSKRTK